MWDSILPANNARNLYIILNPFCTTHIQSFLINPTFKIMFNILLRHIPDSRHFSLHHYGYCAGQATISHLDYCNSFSTHLLASILDFLQSLLDSHWKPSWRLAATVCSWAPKDSYFSNMHNTPTFFYPPVSLIPLEHQLQSRICHLNQVWYSWGSLHV